MLHHSPARAASLFRVQRRLRCFTGVHADGRCVSPMSTSDRPSSLRVGVIGLGAIGSVFFTQLGRLALQQRGGQRTSAVPELSVDAFVKPRHLEQLRKQRKVALVDTQDGKTVEFASIDFTPLEIELVASGYNDPQSSPVRVRTLESTVPTEALDVVIIALKAYDSAQVIQDLRTRHDCLIREDTAIVLMQNGMGELPDAADERSAALPMRNQFFNGVTYIGARVLSLGNVKVGWLDSAATYLASMDKNPSDGAHAKLELLGAVLALSGLKWEMLSHRKMRSVLWTKLIVNAAINPVASMLNSPNGNVGACEWSRRCVEAIVREAVAVATLEGVDLEFTEEDMIAEVLRIAAITAPNVCSTVADLRKGARTEIDAITGRLLHIGASHGVPMPINAFVYDVVKALETQRLRVHSP